MELPTETRFQPKDVILLFAPSYLCNMALAISYWNLLIMFSVCFVDRSDLRYLLQHGDIYKIQEDGIFLHIHNNRRQRFDEIRL